MCPIIAETTPPITWGLTVGPRRYASALKGIQHDGLLPFVIPLEQNELNMYLTDIY